MVSHSTPTLMTIGTVTLTVNDLDQVNNFYRTAMGLQPVAISTASATLGAGGKTLLELRRDSDAKRASPRDAGLFHTAFLLPSRADLARWTRHADEQRLVLQGASDHRVSEAIYLADPEGNGVEIYADRPRSSWKWTNSEVAMSTERLNVQDLLQSAGTTSWRGFPDGSIVGHVHLQVGAIEPAEEFYAALLGFDVTCHYPGATFYSSGGYHHHVATNIWNSRGASARPERTTGLTNVEILAADTNVLERIRSRAPSDRVVASNSSSISLLDPWGTSVTVIVR
jgi:catechol 2,3-dioxygenase